MAGSGRAVVTAVVMAGTVAVLAGCTAGMTPIVTATIDDPTVIGAPDETGMAGACRTTVATAPVDPGSVLTLGPVNGLPASTATGERLVIEALVLDGGCEPAAGASARVWHTDARGRYGPEGTEDCCYYGGVVASDVNGRFRLETIRPGQYPEPGAPPAHIHLEIEHPAGRLETEIVFAEGAGRGTVAVPLRSVDTASWYGEVALLLPAG